MGAVVRKGSVAAILAVAVAVTAACGGEAATPGQRAAVHGLVPDAHEIRCESRD
jgi:hypothetical protein